MSEMVVIYLTVILFTVANNKYAIKIEYVHEAIARQRIVPTPSTSEYVAGMTDVRGKIYACIDIRGILFHERAEWSPNQIFLLTSVEDSLVSYIVDSVDSVIHIDGSKIESSMNKFMNAEEQTIDGVFYYENNLVPLLNMHRITEICNSNLDIEKEISS